uniref:Pectinesterase catalytic domain-containing protein n=1 Tax=Populus trichocarpa TaxID=3694 RepID=A0A2K1XRF6_POPTR
MERLGWLVEVYCHIYGIIDFIFGDASVFFQNYDIFVRRPINHQDNMITAQGRYNVNLEEYNANENTGMSTQGCRVRTSQEFVAKYSRTIIFQLDLDGLIDPRGWREWDANYAFSTLFCVEYQNTGFGASTARRVKRPGFEGPFTLSRFI